MFGVLMVLEPKQLKSPYPWSSVKMITKLGLAACRIPVAKRKMDRAMDLKRIVGFTPTSVSAEDRFSQTLIPQPKHSAETASGKIG